MQGAHINNPMPYLIVLMSLVWRKTAIHRIEMKATRDARQERTNLAVVTIGTLVRSRVYGRSRQENTSGNPLALTAAA